MPTIEDRLRELAQTTHAQLDPSAALLDRILTTTSRAARQPSRRRPQLLVAAAAIIAVAAALTVGLRAQTRDGRQVEAAPITRAQFVIQADGTCRALASAGKQNTLVFPTPAGYHALAAALIATAQPALDQANSATYPADAEPTASALKQGLQASLVQLRLVQTRAATGDTAGAQEALASAQHDLVQATSALAAYGANGCGPAQ